MSKALYRIYRPKQFADVISQQHIVSTLQHQIANQEFAHAYLFTGPRGVGKTSVARLLAKAINQEAITKFKLEDSSLIDIIEIDAASHTGVDNVRENIIQNAYAAPVQLAYKVFIIDEVHMLSVSAFNALLKILEEPPAHVVFILATTEVHKVPDTVKSRCQRFDFHALTLPELVSRLQWICEQEAVSVEPEVIERIARRSGGAVRDAETILGQVLALAEGEKKTTITADQADLVLPRIDLHVVVEAIEALFAHKAREFVNIINKAASSGANVQDMYKYMMQVLRQGMLYSIDQSLDHFAELDTDPTIHSRLVELFSQTNTQQVVGLIDMLLPVETAMKSASLTQLPLETAGVRWALGIQDAPTSAPTQPVLITPVAPVEAPTPKTIREEPVKEPAPAKAVVAPAGKSKTSHASGAAAADPATLQAIQDNWRDIVSTTREHNHALAMSLALAHVITLDAGGVLQLGTKFDFHRAKISEPNNAAAIADVINQLCNTKVMINCVADDQYDVDVSVLNDVPSDNIASLEPVDNVWDLALNTLGGKEVGKEVAKS